MFADPVAAARLILAIVGSGFVECVRAAFGSDVIFVTPHAEQTSGRNAIAQRLASYLAESAGAAPDTGIVQTSRAYHTGAHPIDRLHGRPTFGRPIEPGKTYVLEDDVTVMGGTLAELANHICSNGGMVARAVPLSVPVAGE